MKDHSFCSKLSSQAAMSTPSARANDKCMQVKTLQASVLSSYGDCMMWWCGYRLGTIDARPSYHSQRQLWPVGYQATWQDAAAGTFHCDILEGGDEGPYFAVSLVPPHSEQPAQVSHHCASYSEHHRISYSKQPHKSVTKWCRSCASPSFTCWDFPGVIIGI